jgi:hypothetical protein
MRGLNSESKDPLPYKLKRRERPEAYPVSDSVLLLSSVDASIATKREGWIVRTEWVLV